jgi:hypothetical protein
MRVSELNGMLLNFWVAKAAGLDPQLKTYEGGYQICQVHAPMPLIGLYVFDPIQNWHHAGPIIEKNKLTIVAGDLAAAFREFVSSKFGSNVSDNLPN